MMDEKQAISVEEIWPLSGVDIRPADLRRLSKAEFSELRRRLRRRAKANGQFGSAFNKLERNLIKKRQGNFKLLPISKTALTWKPKPSILLEAFAPKRLERWVTMSKRRKTKKFVLSNFSFLDHPEETLKALANMAGAEANCRNVRVDFNDEKILDMGPYLIWGMMRREMVSFMTGGLINPAISKVLQAVNLHEYMSIKLFEQKDLPDIWSFPIQYKPSRISTDLVKAAPKFSKLADDLVRKVGEWLNALDEPFELTGKGKSSLNNMATEILNNAERHSDPGVIGEWVVAGFMARRKEEGKVSFVCHLTFVSTGSTIAETIAESDDLKVKEYITKYRERHKHWLEYNNISQEALDTVVAMQDGVSRLRQDGDRSIGGVGMMEIAELVAGLGKTNYTDNQHIACIISGSTLVRFADKYSQGNHQGGDRRIQWFNPENSLEKPPDKDYVFTLKQRFPGTIITMRFVLDSVKLREAAP